MAKKGLWANIHAKRKRGEKPAKPGDKGYPKTLDIMEKGGKMKKDYKPHMMYGDGQSKKANTYEEHLALEKKGWSHSKKAQKGGMLKGPSHKKGGIIIEAEGGEIIINKNKNGAAQKHEDKLLALNKNPDNYEIIEKNSKLTEGDGHDYPSYDSKNRRK